MTKKTKSTAVTQITEKVLPAVTSSNDKEESTNLGLKIVVINQGFVYIGRVERTPTIVVIRGAACIREWGTTAGLGQIAKDGPTQQTKLDMSPTVYVERPQVIFYVECVEEKWAGTKLGV